MFNFQPAGKQQPGGNLTGRTSVLEASSGMPMSADPRGAGPFWEPMCSMGLEDFTYIYHDLWQM